MTGAQVSDGGGLGQCRAVGWNEAEVSRGIWEKLTPTGVHTEMEEQGGGGEEGELNFGSGHLLIWPHPLPVCSLLPSSLLSGSWLVN